MTNVDPPLKTAILNIEQTLGQAVKHHRAGRLEEAVALYQSVLHAAPRHAEANHNMGIMAVQVGQPAAALPYFMAALDADPSRGQYWLNYIDALFQADQLETAREVLALAQQQGLQGGEVDALAMTLAGGARVAEEPAAEEPPAFMEPVPIPSAAPENSGDSPSPQEQETSAGTFFSKKNEHPSPQEINSLVDLFGQERFTEAETFAQAMTENFPLHEFGWKALGAVFKQMGRSADALGPMQKAAALSPCDVEAHYNLGVTLQELGRLGDAETSYQRALEINPDYVDAHSNLGVILHDLGRMNAAEASLRRALQIKPDFASGHGNLGLTLQHLGRLDEAEASLRRALQISPNLAEAHNNLGNTLKELGRLGEAEASYQRALAINPNYADAHNNLGIVLQNMGRSGEAEDSYRRALQLKPDYAEAYSNLGHTLKDMGRLDEAETVLRRALQISPDYADAHCNLGATLTALVRLDEAEVSYRRALQVNPQFARAHSNLGAILRDLGRLDEAAASYRRALEIKPDFAEACINLGNTLKELGRPDEAETSYRQAIQIRPDSAEAHYNLGISLQDRGLPDEAEACFRLALRCNPERRTIETFIYSVATLRKFEDGAQFLRSLNADFPGNGYLTFAEGWLRANAGHFEEAETLINEAVQLIPALSSKADYSCSKSALPIWLPPYRNEQAREMSDEEWRYAELSDACFVEPTSLIAKTRIIAIEISNICNYGTIHPRCPVHNYKTKEVLPADSIKRILDELGEIGFTGCIGWGCYTEPLIDPRLVDLVSYARKVCPVAKNSLTTNGFYLTEDSAADLVSAGIDQIFVSAYSMSEYLRLILLPIPASYTVYNSKLEKRTEDNVYSRKPLDSNARCLPFILNLMITCRGDLGLCCFDFERRHTFGNIHTATLRELLSNQAVIEVHRRLAAGDRSVLDACRRCGNGFSSYPYWLAA